MIYKRLIICFCIKFTDIKYIPHKSSENIEIVTFTNWKSWKSIYAALIFLLLKLFDMN